MEVRGKVPGKQGEGMGISPEEKLRAPCTLGPSVSSRTGRSTWGAGTVPKPKLSRSLGHLGKGAWEVLEFMEEALPHPGER